MGLESLLPTGLNLLGSYFLNKANTDASDQQLANARETRDVTLPGVDVPKAAGNINTQLGSQGDFLQGQQTALQGAFKPLSADQAITEQNQVDTDLRNIFDKRFGDIATIEARRGLGPGSSNFADNFADATADFSRETFLDTPGRARTRGNQSILDYYKLQPGTPDITGGNAAPVNAGLGAIGVQPNYGLGASAALAGSQYFADAAKREADEQSQRNFELLLSKLGDQKGGFTGSSTVNTPVRGL